MLPFFQDLDLSSEQGRALISELAGGDSGALARAAITIPERLFQLRSPFAPGLTFIGGQTEPRRIFASCESTERFSLAGSGETAATALASCIGEGVERLSQVAQPRDSLRSATLNDVRGQLLRSALPAVEVLLEDLQLPRTVEIDWMYGKSLANDEPVLLPADWCLRRQQDKPFADKGRALSTGVAAGSSFASAAVRALLELVERDAASLWWIGGRRGRPLAADGGGMAPATDLLATLRQGSAARVTWLLDLTTDLEIPCVAALSTDARGRGLACGLSARITIGDAVRSAIFEMCQMELALVVVSAKRQQQGEAALSAVDQGHMARASIIDGETCELMHPRGIPRRPAHPAIREDEGQLALLKDIFHARGIEAAVIDLTRAELGIPVVRAVAPTLQHMPGSLVSERLKQEIAHSGGAYRWTQDLPLM